MLNCDLEQRVSITLRAQVLERNGYACTNCGAGAGEPDELNPGRRTRLRLGRIQDPTYGEESLDDLCVLCGNCIQGANVVSERLSWTWLLAQVRRATPNNQRRAFGWLDAKFRECG